MNSLVFIRRSGALGDVILVHPVIRFFLEQGSGVVFYSGYSCIYKPQHKLVLKESLHKIESWVYLFLSKIFPSRIKWIDLDGAYEQNPHLSIIDAYKLKAKISEPLEPVDSDAFVVDNSEPSPAKPYILFHIQAPSCKLNYRNIHGIDWLRINQALSELGYRCIEIIQKDKDYTPVFPSFIRQDISELMAYMKQADAFVGLDSSPMHIASMFGVKSFVFFGSVNPALRLDDRQFKGHVFQNSCDFAGCYHTVKGTSGAVCRIVGNEGKPPCCTFQTEEVLETMIKFLQQKTT